MKTLVHDGPPRVRVKDVSDATNGASHRHAGARNRRNDLRIRPADLAAGPRSC